MAESLRHRDSGDAGHWGLLGAALPDIGGQRTSSQRRECKAYENTTRAQNRCIGMPMVAEAPHVRIAEQLVPARRRDSDITNLLASAGKHGRSNQYVHSAYAEGADPDESPTGQRDQ